MKCHISIHFTEYMNKKDNSLGHLTLELSAFRKNVLSGPVIP